MLRLDINALIGMNIKMEEIIHLLATNAKIHEDIWWATVWIYKGHYLWPDNPWVELTEEEYEHLFPGLKNHGIPDAQGALHWPKRKVIEQANRRKWWYRSQRRRSNPI